MRILFDHDTPRPLRRYLTEHTVDTAYEKGWAELRNGPAGQRRKRKLRINQSMRYQQNLEHRRIAIIVLLSNKWPRILSKVEDIRCSQRDTR